MTSNSPGLTYAPRTRVRWLRRPIVRRTLSFVFIVGLSLGTWSAWRGSPGQFLRIRYWYWACRRYTSAADKIVYALHDPEAERVMGGDADSTAACPPDCLTLPHPWCKLAGLWGHGSVMFPTEAGLLLHSFRTSNGGEGLVAIAAFWAPFDEEIGELMVRIQMIDPTMLPGPPNKNPFEFVLILPSTTSAVRFYAGQPDPGDPTHFTLPYRCDGQSGIIDVYLQDDQHPTIKVRSGPLVLTNLDM